DLERADPVGRALEDVVGAADEPEVPLRVARGRVARPVVTPRHHRAGAGEIVRVVDHQAEGARLEVDGQLSLAGLPAVEAEQVQPEAGRGAGPGADLPR